MKSLTTFNLTKLICWFKNFSFRHYEKWNNSYGLLNIRYYSFDFHNKAYNDHGFNHDKPDALKVKLISKLTKIFLRKRFHFASSLEELKQEKSVNLIIRYSIYCSSFPTILFWIFSIILTWLEDFIMEIPLWKILLDSFMKHNVIGIFLLQFS